MKRNIFIKTFSTSFLATALAFSFAACGDSGERSTVQGAEEIIEEEEENLNNPSVVYEDGEYGVVTDNVNYNIDQEYVYEERTIVSDRLREDIDRIDSTLERINLEREELGAEADPQRIEEWQLFEVMLERNRTMLNQTLMKVENSSEENWNEIRRDVNTSLRSWEKEWEQYENSEN